MVFDDILMLNQQLLKPPQPPPPVNLYLYRTVDNSVIYQESPELL